MFLAAAEELRIKGLSQASNDSKLEKLDNSVPKIKQASGGSNTNSTSSVGQPPAKKPRESSPGMQQAFNAFSSSNSFLFQAYLQFLRLLVPSLQRGLMMMNPSLLNSQSNESLPCHKARIVLVTTWLKMMTVNRATCSTASSRLNKHLPSSNKLQSQQEPKLQDSRIISTTFPHSISCKVWLSSNSLSSIRKVNTLRFFFVSDCLFHFRSRGWSWSNWSNDILTG
jgi:hypothetical protein